MTNPENKLQAAAQVVADHLFAAEHAMDAAFLALSEACAALPVARMETRTAAEAGQRSFVGAAAALGELANARGRVVRWHREVAIWAKRLNLDPTSFGGGVGKPTLLELPAETESELA